MSNPRGRPKGSPNKATAARAAAVAASGLTPLDYMLDVLRSEESAKEDRHWAAAQAAPYVHPRLAAIEATGKDGSPLIPEAGEFVPARQLAMAILSMIGDARREAEAAQAADEDRPAATH